MRKVLLLAASALLVPGVALAEGYVSGSYQYNEETSAGGSNQRDIYSLTGRILVTENIMLDGDYAAIEDNAGNEIDVWGIGGHVFGRGENWLLGGYVGYESDTHAGSNTIDGWTLAAEGQHHVDRVTLGASVAYSVANGFSISGKAAERLTVSGDVRVFVTDNFSLHGTATWASLFEPGPGPFRGYGSAVGIDAEYQFDGAPVSIFAGYRNSNADSFAFDNHHTWGIGLRWNFGDATLIQRDRSGARLSQPVGIYTDREGVVLPR